MIAEFKDLTTLPANDPLKYSSMSYIYLNGVQVAFQQGAHQTTGDKHVVWTYHNPTVGNYFAEYQLNDSNQQQQNIPYGEMTFDPLGSYVGLAEQQALDIPAPFTFSMGQFIDSNTGKCYADHVETSCTIVQSALNNGWGVQAPWGSSAIGMNRYSTSDTSFDFIVDWDNGFFGFVPTGMPLIPELINGQGMWVDPETAMSGSLQSIRGHMPKIDHLPTIGAQFTQNAYSNTIYPVIYNFVNNPECVSAFSDIGIDLVDRLTGEGKGIRIGPTGLILHENPTRVKQLLGLTDAGFTNYQEVYRGGIGNAYTLSHQDYLVQNSLPTILLTETALNNGNRHLAETLAHELVHAGGIHGRTDFRQSIWERIVSYIWSGPANRPHDLDHVADFNKVIDDCTRSYR